MSFDDTTVKGKPTIVHDPEAVLDYGWDLTDLIDDSDTVSSVEFVAPTGATVTEKEVLGSVAYGWLSITDVTLVGQTIGVTCRYTTANGRTDDRTLYFKIKDR